MIEYTLLSAAQAQQQINDLTAVLQACVADGASVGFIDAADHDVMTRFWQQRLPALLDGSSELLVARQHECIVATVIISYCAVPNGRHRAEISKLLVHPQARRQGIARVLMERAAQRAAAHGRTLLVLDTRSGDVASDLYRSLGWQAAGSIPGYARSTAGVLDATTYMYKTLTPAAGTPADKTL